MLSMLHGGMSEPPFAGPFAVRRLVSDKDTGKPKGYAFCEYHDIHAAEAAVRNLNSTELGGRQLRVDYAEDHSRGEHDGGRKDRDRDRDRRPMDKGGRWPSLR